MLYYSYNNSTHVKLDRQRRARVRNPSAVNVLTSINAHRRQSAGGPKNRRKKVAKDSSYQWLF